MQPSSALTAATSSAPINAPIDALAPLVRQAAALGDGEPVSARAAEAEVARVMGVCNACRYCEGFCAVFPAMTRRLDFPSADVHYLANLCHNCGACLHACQYAPPHEFGINVPQAMARVRHHTYQAYAWPAAFGKAYRHNGLVVAVVLAFALTLFLALGAAMQGSLWPFTAENAARADGNFYRVFPHGFMVALFAPPFLFAAFALAVGAMRFWRAKAPGAISASAAAEASSNALRLKYLDGGHGEGCNEQDDRFTHARRHAHHATFYGFMLCFAATSVATLYHYAFGWQAPYAYTALPKLLGLVGGVLLCLGTVGLWRLNRKRHPLQGDAAQAPMDLAFIALLFFTASTGLLLTALRAAPAMALLLCLHLGCVMALFITLPYGKFAHAVYRCAALLKWQVERRQPLNIKLGSE